MSRRAVTVPLPNGVTRVVSKSGKEYWYHQHRRGKPDAGPRTKLPEFGTPEFWAAIAKLTGTSRAPSNTVKDLIAAYKQEPEWKGHRPATQKSYSISLDRIEEAWGHLDPAAITVAGVMALRAAYADRPSMGNQILIQVTCLMQFAVQTGKRADNPAREVKKLVEDPDEAKPLTEAAWDALMNAPEPLRRFAFLGRATGQRISDVLPMKPSGRDADGITCKIKKLHDKEHWCLLRPDEAATIDGWRVFKSAFYMAHPNGQRFTERQMRDAWNAYAATEEGAALRGFTPHDLRATKVCDERVRGVPHQQIAARVGMSLKMVMKYSRHIDQRLAARGTSEERHVQNVDKA